MTEESPPVEAYASAVANETEPEFDDLLLMLKETRGFDFTGYKPTTLARRIRRRMETLGLKSFGEYRDYLELDGDEFALLFDSLLINVTAFFRDPPAWEALRQSILPEMLAAKGPSRPIRIWSAGCATGQEAYTLAMVLAEVLGGDAFRERVKIYATDEDALQQARTGTYTTKELAEVPADLRERYFEIAGGRGTFRRDLRRQVIFGRNDLTHDAPISRVDLVVARNTLMYFNAETQTNVVRRFHFALTDPGYLFLGKAEMLLSHGNRFEPVDLRKRLFRKIPTAPAQATVRARTDGVLTEPPPQTVRLQTAALDAGPIAQLALDLAGRLAIANPRAETLFNLRPRDIGKPFQDLEVSYRPIELRSVIEQVQRERRPVELHDITWRRTPGAGVEVFDVHVIPLFTVPDELTGVGISFADVTHRRLREELEHANQELERAYEELQSLNEELETTNEELQSTNEQLETTNEELQSTNDELQEINDALRIRTEELDVVNSFLGSVLRSLGNAVVVVDQDLRVKVWGTGAEELWGLRPDEAQGRRLPGLDIGLPLGEVVTILKRALLDRTDHTGTVTVEAVNRRGRPVTLAVECHLLRGVEADSAEGAILVMNESARTEQTS